MHRHCTSPRNEELYIHSGQIKKKNMEAIKRQLRYHFDSQRTENDQKKDKSLAVKKCYDRVLKELMHTEQISQIEKAFKQIRDLCEMFLKPEEISELQDTWADVSRWISPVASDILLNKLRIEAEMEEFDETDLKFKQEMTILRAKMFSAPKEIIQSRFEDNVTEPLFSNHIEKHGLERNFVEAMRKHDTPFSSINDVLSEVRDLKFVDGEFAASEIWSKALDAHGEQLRSKWLLVFCPQVARIMRKRRVHTLHLNPLATFNFLSSIRENGFNFLLTKEHLLTLLQNLAAEASWLTSWSLQFRTIEGKDIAATLIQTLWRGYWLRQRIRESERRYVAASVLWFAWITLLKKRQMQQRYFDKIQTSLNVTRQLSSEFSNDFDRYISEPHVILIIPSLGYPMEIRRTIDPKALTVRQNTMSLRISLTRNPRSEVIYVLPIHPSEDLLSMYRDVVNSVNPEESAAQRITYVALSEAKTFERRSMNVSRILHCSEVTLETIRKKIAGKRAYILPWIIDDCDVRLADNLGLPIMGPDLEFQREMLHFSRISEIVDSLGLLQPAHARNVRDYRTICDALADLIVINTEISMWLIRLNTGVQLKHCGMFLINHISVPFMPLLRKERAKFGDEWKVNFALRARFREALSYQLPKIVSKVTKLSSYYASWKEFYAQVRKFGCLLQALPDEKNSTIASVSLFVPDFATGNKPKWIGTADKIRFENSFATFAYMLPQTTIENFHLEPAVNKFALAMQERGYFGYLTIDCYCFPHKYEENIVVLILGVHPDYCLVQQYIDWMKFAIDGRYSQATNKMNTDVVVPPRTRKRKPLYALSPPKWNETSERYAIAILHLHHDRFATYSWSRLKTIIEDCGITYNATTKEGSHLILHDSEKRNSATFVVISPNMNTALTTTHSSLSKLYDALRADAKEKPDTNLQEIADFFANLSLEYRDLSADQCT